MIIRNQHPIERKISILLEINYPFIFLFLEIVHFFYHLVFRFLVSEKGMTNSTKKKNFISSYNELVKRITNLF